MTQITVRQASEEEQNDCQSWDLWDSGDAKTYEYSYEFDTEFIVQSGEATIRSQFGDCVTISAGCRILINKGVEGKWEIPSPISNRYRYL